MLKKKTTFDFVNHDTLLSKMWSYGIRGIAHSWLKSYLSNRKQYIQLDQHKSQRQDIIVGLSQGSILGPKLFLLFINDLLNSSDILKYVHFADDTTVFCSGDNLNTDENSLKGNCQV